MDKYSNKEQLFLHLDGISIDDLIMSEDYYISNIDIWILSNHYRIYLYKLCFKAIRKILLQSSVRKPEDDLYFYNLSNSPC